MRYHTRAFAVFLLILPLAVGCARAAREPRVTEAPSPAPTVVVVPPAGTSAQAGTTTSTTTSTPMQAAAPIPGHPPVTTSGVVASYDPATGVLTFKDGRMVKLTEQSKVLQPVETRAVRPGEPVIVRNALPVGVQSASSATGSAADRAKTSLRGKRHRMGTVASIDEPNQVVRLTDGTAVRVTPSTQMHMGTAGKTMVLTDLQPGDELVIVLVDDGAPAAGGAASKGIDPTTERTVPVPPSALPRQVPASVPSDASELMVFRDIQAP